ncbi:hypothetical protein CR513_54684, partial [Mucuna pruriens]
MPRCEGTPRLKGVINTIEEGFVGGSSSSTKRWYLCIVNSIRTGPDRVPQQLPPITFTDQDFVRSNQTKRPHVKVDTSYNILIDRPTLNTLGAIVFTPHLVMKFPYSDGQVVTIKANQKMAQQCYIDSLRVVTKPPSKDNVSAHVEISTDVELNPRPQINQGAELIEKIEKIP